jgi:hypothetical protein
MSNHDLWHVLNKMSADKQDPAVQAVAALLEDDYATVLEITGRAHMEVLQESGLMEGMDMVEVIERISGHPPRDAFTTALLCLCADLLARQSHGVAQARYESLRRQLGPRDL